ncbi:MAG: hypothetical protein JXQ23_09630 [Clostridia bacterium]|nr:hypothetical protein [Clostridia bacterium]
MALIGFMTNETALLSLFKPYEAIKLHLLGICQEILPGRQKEPASCTGTLVEEELIIILDLIESNHTKSKPVITKTM